MPEGKGRTERYLTTVLMTDIVGSTEHAAQMGDSEWRELIAQHHKIVRAALRRHRGREIDTAGDGFFATFDAPAAAVRCALEIARDVRALGIEVRAGLHTGEVEQAGPKVSGIAVPTASRIMAAAGPGEVLVSGTVRDLAAGAGIEFEDRGTRQLKGVPGEWHIYAAASPSLASDDQASTEEAAELRAAAVQRRRSRPIWQRRPRLVSGVAILLVVVLVGGALLVWQPWLPPALPQVGSDSVGVIDGSRSAIVASIKVDSQPAGVVVAGDSAWVANTGSNTVSQVDIGKHQVSRVIDVGGNPVGVAEAAGSIWVANSGDRTVSRINEATGRVVSKITVGNGPLALAALDNSIWVANYTDSTMVRIDAQSGSTLPSVPVASGPVAVATDTNGVWIASADAATVTRLDAASGASTAPIVLPCRPTSIAAAAGGIWVACADGTVTRIDPATQRVTTTVDVGGSLSSIVASGNTVWVGDRDGSVLRLDASNPSASAVRVATTNAPQALAIDQGNVWVATGSALISHRGGTLRVVANEAPDLDVTSFAGVAELQADGLAAYKRIGGAAGVALVADLATALPKPTDGGVRYTFQLRSGLHYTDGTPILASDFRRGIERGYTILDPNLGEAAATGLFSDIVGTDACVTEGNQPVASCDLSSGIVTDDQAGVVTFVLTRPNASFPYLLALPIAYPVPPTVPLDTFVEGAFPGTGPYTVTHRDGALTTLTRNPNFSIWDADARPDGFPDQIDWITQANIDDAVAMVERGDADYMRFTLGNSPSADTIERLATQYPGQLRFAPDSLASITFNTKVAPFNVLEVRKAVNLALDRQHIVDLRGGSSAAAITCQYLLPGSTAYEPYCPYTTHPDAGGRWQAPDLDTARQLVAQSGTSGTRIVVGPSLDLFVDVRDYLATVLREIGYTDVTTDTNTTDDYVFQASQSGQTQATVWEWFRVAPTPADQLGSFVCSQSAEGTFSSYCDPAYDALVAEAQNLQASDVAAANEKWAQADRMLVDAAPWAPIFTEGSDFLSSRVGNYQFHLLYGSLLDQMWVQ